MKNKKNGLLDLEDNIRCDFEYLNFPPDNWVKPKLLENGSPVTDVTIVGGGMCGMAASFGLKREGIRNIRIFDRQPESFEGPWLTTARMKTLRSPKHLTGPNMGLPNLTFQAWYRAQWDTDSWEALGHIPREMWMEYLRWYRQVLEIPVENGVALERIEPEGDILKLFLLKNGQKEEHFTRKLVLATGRAAFGGTRLPAAFQDLPENLYAHTEDKIDFEALKGKKVFVIGGAASAVDSAAVALETGAAEVHLMVRAKEIPRLNKFKSTVYSGFFRGFKNLDEETRWRLLHHGFGCKIAAPRASMLRLKQYENFHIHLDSPIAKARADGDSLELSTGTQSYQGDFVILGTGYAINIADQPELAPFSKDVLLWRDRFTPPADIADEELGNFPFLGPGFELLEKTPGQASYLDRIHLFNAATTMTHSAVSSDIPGVNIGAERLIDTLAKKFFAEAAPEHLQDFYDYDEPELLGDEWN
ncbi:MAG: NAD(P)/FAD-dependent oxidoreductase [Proteobacteria bacterium]|nr:NAD(P)/FAD-dependent oxidoreductase [Pseudomonadota bacterium]